MAERARQQTNAVAFLSTLKELRDVAETEPQHPDFHQRKLTIEATEKGVHWLCSSYFNTLPAESSVDDINASLRQLQRDLKEQRAALKANGGTLAQHRVVQIEADIKYLIERLRRKLLAPEADATESADRSTSEGPAHQGKAMIFV